MEAILDTRVRSKTFGAIIEADIALADIQVHLTHRVYKLVFKRQLPHKSINLLSVFVIIKDKSTDFWGSCLQRNDFVVVIEADIARVDIQAQRRIKSPF